MTFSSDDNPVSPTIFDGYEHISRYWDKQTGLWTAKLLPGDIYVTNNNEVLSTLLGSCIAVCIRDQQSGVGGMNHFMLPDKNRYSSHDWGSNPVTYASRYGVWAMEFLINEILKHGGQREQLELKVFGGGKVIEGLKNDVGERNIQFLKDYVQREGLTISASDTGDNYPRKVIYFPATGRVKVKKVQEVPSAALLQKEASYLRQLLRSDHDESEGDIDIF